MSELPLLLPSMAADLAARVKLHKQRLGVEAARSAMDARNAARFALEAHERMVRS